MYANGTTHYNLPQTVGTDKRDWTDTNQAFADIDAALYTASETASSAASDIVTLGETVGTHGFKLQDHFRIKGSCPRAEAVVYFPNSSISLPDSEYIEDIYSEDMLYCPVFGNCSGSLEINIPFEAESGGKGSLEYLINIHTGGKYYHM